jgi:hypothetical protein
MRVDKHHRMHTIHSVLRAEHGDLSLEQLANRQSHCLSKVRRMHSQVIWLHGHDEIPLGVIVGGALVVHISASS